jgi:type I restriction enzyme M protein
MTNAKSRSGSTKRSAKPGSLHSAIATKLKDAPEQHDVVGPVVERLCEIGWSLEQIVFGKSEWRVPKSPSEQTKREKGKTFLGFPVDIAVFDDPANTGDPRHLLFMIECKQPNETAGVSQLEGYFVAEPHARLGVWANNAASGSAVAFLFRDPSGRLLLKRRLIDELPRPGEPIEPDTQRTTFRDLIAPPEHILRQTVEDLLDKVVINDSNVTRREEQLDQLCNLLLLKLESDKQAKSNLSEPAFFRMLENAQRTAAAIRSRYESFVALYPDTFTTDHDKRLRLSDSSIAMCVDALAGLRLIDLGVSTVSVAFQILRSEALKQGEGQYFTPQAVIEAGVRLMRIDWEDIVLDPACGTGGFLVESMREIQRRNPYMAAEDLTRWAQTHIFGVEKDAIGLKLTKAIMQIAGDGSAHCVRGDSIRVHDWARDFPHLAHPQFANGRFTKILTNPPFGQNLKVSGSDCRLSSLEIAKRGGDTYSDLEIGLLFLQRAYDWLRIGGWVGIVLPETYFFSANYAFVFDWMKTRFRPLVVANVPMDAFQGFCRAKTNFYVLEKIA